MAEAQESRGQEGYGRQEEEIGWEAEFPKWREAGEEEKNFAVLHDILQ